MSVTEPEFPPTATELDALVERIDELDEIDELVDWQLNRPEFVRRRNEIDRCEDLVGVVPALRDEGSYGVEPAALVVVVVARWATCSNVATKPLGGPNLLRLRDVAELGRATVAAEYSLAGCLLAVVGGSFTPCLLSSVFSSRVLPGSV